MIQMKICHKPPCFLNYVWSRSRIQISNNLKDGNSTPFFSATLLDHFSIALSLDITFFLIFINDIPDAVSEFRNRSTNALGYFLEQYEISRDMDSGANTISRGGLNKSFNLKFLERYPDWQKKQTNEESPGTQRTKGCDINNCCLHLKQETV